MDGVAAGHDGGRDDGRGREVAPPGVGRADADRLVGELGGEGVAVGLAVGEDGADPHGPAGAQDPEGDLAAVGDEDALEHQPASGRVAVAGAVGRRWRDGGRSRGRRSQQLDLDDLLAVLHRVAGLHEARPHDPVGRRGQLLGDAEHVDRAEGIAGAHAGARGHVRARAVEAHRGRGGDRARRRARIRSGLGAGEEERVGGAA